MSNDKYDQIIEAVRERGTLTRAELIGDWGLTLEAYSDLMAAARAAPDIGIRRGRTGGLEALGKDAESSVDLEPLQVDEDEEPEYELFESVLDMLRSSRTLTREELSEVAGLNSPDEYKGFARSLVGYAAEKGLVIERKRGRGGVELKETAEELYERLKESEEGRLTTTWLKELSGLEDRSEYKELLDEIEALASAEGREIRRLRGQGGIVLVRTPIEVLGELRARRRMSKADLIELANIEADRYPRLVEELLLEAGQTGVEVIRVQGQKGGFEVSDEQPDRGDESSEAAVLEPWQQAAVEVLTELDATTLEEIAGKSLYTAVRRVSGRRGRAPVATAIVLKYGVDLLAETNIREALAEARGLEAPRRWHAAGQAAQRFVEALGLPSRFAGERENERRPDIQLLEGRTHLKRLEDYQSSVKEQLLHRLETRGSCALVSLPTGAGKTRVAVDTLRELLTREYDTHQLKSAGGRGVVLWLAHTEELCEQACQCVIDVWSDSPEACPLGLVRFWGHYSNFSEKHEEVSARLDAPCIIVSTPQRLENIRHKANVDNVEAADEFLERLQRSLRLIVIDEAHRAAAPIYRSIAEHYQSDGVSLVGLTATPFRNVGSPELGAQELQQIFHQLVEPRRIEEVENPDSQQLRRALQARGVLAEPTFEEIPTNVNLGTVERNPDEMSLSEIAATDQRLAKRADVPARRQVVLERLLPVAKQDGTSIIYFGPTVKDAEIMAYMLQYHGIRTAVVSGSTRDPARKQVISEFKQGRIKVLCNCEILTTGFDHPPITHVVIARPTMSQVLYEQMVGRGLRGARFGGTSTCTILDCLDNFPGGRRPQLGFDRFRETWGLT